MVFRSPKEVASPVVVVLDEEDACTPPKKKHKKERKHKYKKHSGEKSEKIKKHKKHKKHKHKHNNVVETEQRSPAQAPPPQPPVASNKTERFTPELTPKRDKKVANGQVVDNVKVTTENKTIKTDADEVVKFVSGGISSTHTLEVISSESEPEQEAECDSDAIDVSVIEADMDLEELMKQKELLQAEIAKAELETPSPVVILVDGKKNGNKVTKVEDEVILLDDSSEGEVEIKQKRKKSKSRERRVVISSREYATRNDTKRYRSRSKERTNHRDSERQRHERAPTKEVNR